jgi:hypothetical protein
VRCPSEFQNHWAPPIDGDGTCDDFISGIQSAHPVDFYFNLRGAQPAFYFGDAAETCNRCGGVDSADFFFMATASGASGGDAAYAMWDDNIYAWTSKMRLGDSGRQLKALATFRLLHPQES